MARIRWAAVRGSLDAGISDSDTTISSPELADLPEVVAPDVAAIILDPTGLTGSPEIVWVTAHAASATTATVERGQETESGGAVARAHLSGVLWRNGPTPQDFATTDAALDVTATAGFHKSATAATAFGTVADALHVSDGTQGRIAGNLPYIVTAAGAKQDEINDNAAAVGSYAMGIAGLGMDGAFAADTARVVAQTGLALIAADGVTTLEADQFDLHTDYMSGDSLTAMWTAPVGFTAWTEFWARTTVTILEDRLDPTPTDGQIEYSERFTQSYAAGSPGQDTIEWAIESIYSAALGRWQHYIYWEHTPTGALTDSYKIFGSQAGARRCEIPVGVPTDIAVWVILDDGSSQSVGRLLMAAPYGHFDLTADGTNWRIVAEKIDAVTDIEANPVDDWWMGAGYGHVLSPGVEVRDGGPAGTVVADPNTSYATDASTPFVDGAANTWTPEADCAIVAGTPAPIIGDVVGPASATDARVALFDGTTGKLLKQASGGYLAVGTTTGTVAAGDDSRLSDSRAPSGSAGGSLTGTYPNPTIAAGVIDNAAVSTSAAIARSKIAVPPSGLYVAGSVYHHSCITGGSRTVAPGALAFFPIVLDGPCTIDGLMIDVGTGAGSGTAHLYLVSANASTGLPDNASTVIRATSSLISTASSGTRAVGALTSSYSAPAGIYWAAIHAIVGTATYRAAAAGYQFGPPVPTFPAGTSSANGCTAIVATGGGTSTTALTDMSGVTFGTNTTQATIIGWRAA